MGRPAKRSRIAVALAVLLTACGESEPAAPVVQYCTRSDINNACTSTTPTAVRESVNQWVVTVPRTVTETITYTDRGVQCSLTQRSCRPVVCNIFAPNNWTSTDAINYCLRSIADNP